MAGEGPTDEERVRYLVLMWPGKDPQIKRELDIWSSCVGKDTDEERVRYLVLMWPGKDTQMKRELDTVSGPHVAGEGPTDEES